MTTAPSAVATGAALPSWFDAFGATLLVLALVAAAAWLLRSGYLPFPRRRGPASRLAVESALSLGDKRSLVVVAVEGRRLLLGLTPAAVSLVTELDVPSPAFDQALERAAAAGERP